LHLLYFLNIVHDEFVVGIGVPRVMLICGVTCRQMRAQSNARAEDLRAREEERRLVSEATQVKAERVRRELERIELKASLLEVIKSLDEVCLTCSL
jgi:hypothetical protein